MFNFFFSSPMANNAGKSMAKGLLVLGLILIGFSMLVWVLREVFAFIAAGIFMVAGFACLINSLKLYFKFRNFGRKQKPDSPYRENVRIHYNEQ